MGTESFFACGKYGHKVRDFPIIATKGREGKQVPPSVLGDYDRKKTRFYALRARGSKSDDNDDDGKFLYFLRV